MMARMDYKIVQQKKVVVVAFTGNLSGEDRDRMLACASELERIKGSVVIFYFRNTQVVEPVVFRDLTQLQHQLRKRMMEVYHAGLNLQLKLTLSEKGVIRLSEVKGSLGEVLSGLVA
jgi:hypothetical protein